MNLEHRVVYFSPAGTTRQVAEFIALNLRQRGCEVELINLAQGCHDEVLAEWPERCCLWLGSPVYCDHAVPLVEAFVRLLSPFGTGYSVPFVTWGGVTSGLALPELATLLTEHHYPPIGAAKVLALHSSMWLSQTPLGAGHPDAGDYDKIAALGSAVLAKLKCSNLSALPQAVLDYLPPVMKASSAGKSLAVVKTMMPVRQLDQERCDQCGRCVAVCPVAAITMTPFPRIEDHCVLCLMCVRNCPNDVFLFDAAATEGRLISMAQNSDETQETRVFF